PDDDADAEDDQVEAVQVAAEAVAGFVGVPDRLLDALGAPDAQVLSSPVCPPGTAGRSACYPGTGRRIPLIRQRRPEPRRAAPAAWHSRGVRWSVGREAGQPSTGASVDSAFLTVRRFFTGRE